MPRPDQRPIMMFFAPDRRWVAEAVIRAFDSNATSKGLQYEESPWTKQGIVKADPSDTERLYQFQHLRRATLVFESRARRSGIQDPHQVQGYALDHLRRYAQMKFREWQGIADMPDAANY